MTEDSFSFKSVLDGDLKNPTRDHILYLSGANKICIKKGDWKYISCLGSGEFTRPYEMKLIKNGPKGQLFNLRTDSMELNNLYLPEPTITFNRTFHRVVRWNLLLCNK